MPNIISGDNSSVQVNWQSAFGNVVPCCRDATSWVPWSPCAVALPPDPPCMGQCAMEQASSADLCMGQDIGSATRCSLC